MMDLPILIIIWTVCAVVSWWIATTKRAPDAGMWAAAGLFLGPLGVLSAIAFAKPARPGTEGRTCVRCGKIVAHDRERLCNHCGEPFAVA